MEIARLPGPEQNRCTKTAPAGVVNSKAYMNRRARRLERLYAEHQQPLYRYALSLTRDPARAEDAVHNAFAKLLARPWLPLRLKAYAFRCVRNAAVDAWRREPAGAAELGDGSGLPAASPDRGRWEELERALNRLADDEREVVLLKTMDELTFREIARVTGEPLHTVASRYRRALAKLRERLRRE